MLFRVLGPLEIAGGEVRVQGMARRLLTALLVDAGRVVTVDRLLDALWGDEPPATAAGTLQTHVSRLRARLSVLGDRVALRTREPGYVLDVDPGEIDAAVFERLVARARAAGDEAGAVAAYAEALDLWRGAAYAGFADEEFARPAAVRLEEARLSAAEERIDALLALGRHAEVQGELEELAAAHPLRERFRAQLMLANYRSGRAADALDVYREYRARLADELGLDPSPELQQLERAVLTQAADLDAAPAGVAVAAAVPEPPAGAEHPAEPERKLVSVLLASVDAPWSVDSDPEDHLAALEPAVAAMRAAAHRYEGTVYRVSSHGVAVLFGAPLAQEDHAVRACYAGLALADAVRAAAGVTARVAVQSGEVLVRTVRTDLSTDYEPVGAAVQLAERLLERTPAGGVSASAETVRLAAGRVEAREAPGEDPRRWSILRATRRTPWEARTLRGLTAFAGRTTELDLLRARLASAADGDGQVVAVVGEAGVGKSRLCDEFGRRWLPGGWIKMSAAATATENRTPYHPLATMLRNWLGLPDDAEEAAVAAGVEERCAALGALALSAPLLALLDLPVADEDWDGLEPGQRRRRTHTALIDLLLALTADAPLLLVVEDLHWIDAETAAVLDATVDAAATAPLLVLVTYRPEHVPGWVNRSHVTTLHLGPLRAGDAERFLSALVGEDPTLEQLKARLLEWTGGLPLFLEETVSALAEDGVLEGGPGAYTLARPDAGISVPTTVHGVLAARLDRLPARQKSLLQTAAVIGTGGPIDLLLDCAGTGEDELAADLAALRQAEFLFERRRGTEVSFTFKHAITHDTVYASLSRSPRRRLHRRVAEVIRARHGARPSEQLARLGRHALGAEDWEEAALLLRQAAEQALDRSAHHEASDLLEMAVEALGHVEATPETVATELDARIALRPAAAALGELRRAMRHLERAEALAREAGDHERLVAIKVHQSFTHDLIGDIAEAVATGEEGLRIATDLGDDVLVAECRLAIAQAHALSGNARPALDALSPSMGLLTGALRLERHGQAGIRGVWALGHAALAHAVLGDVARAAELARESAEVARTGGRTVDRGFAAFVEGFVALERGEERAAGEHFLAGEGITTEGDVPLIGTWNRAWSGLVHVRTGALAEAEAGLRRLLAETVARELLLVEGWVRVHLAELHLARDEPEAAAAEAGTAVALASRLHHHMTRGRALRLLGEAAAALDDPEGAEAHFASALAATASSGARADHAQVELARGRARARAQRCDEARADLDRALAAFSALGLSNRAAEARQERAALG